MKTQQINIYELENVYHCTTKQKGKWLKSIETNVLYRQLLQCIYNYWVMLLLCDLTNFKLAGQGCWGNTDIVEKCSKCRVVVCCLQWNPVLEIHVHVKRCSQCSLCVCSLCFSLLAWCALGLGCLLQGTGH